MANNANGAGAGKHPFRNLLVCEANVCRSPMAEYLLRQSLADRRADAPVFELTSAGTTPTTAPKWIRGQLNNWCGCMSPRMAAIWSTETDCLFRFSEIRGGKLRPI